MQYPLLVTVLKLMRTLFHASAAPFFLFLALAVCLLIRIQRKLKPRKIPRILWGPTAIGGTQYYSRACHLYGYESSTLMYGCSFINERKDFDYYPETLFPFLSRLPIFLLIYPYLCFLWVLPRYEVHFHNFDGGFLRGTLLRFLETDLWHLAGGKNVLYCYGGDAQLPRLFHDLTTKHNLIRDYPGLARAEQAVSTRIMHYTRTSDFIFASGEAVDYLPYWDFLMMQLSALDTEAISPEQIQEENLKKKFPGKKIIFHAPNHRNIKGTDLLIKACEELKKEGRTDFELVIYERQSNQTVLEAMKASDIVADQFIMGYYAMFALEAMALEKPVLCYLRPDLYELYSYYSWAKECPVIHAPRDQIKESLTRLLDSEEERKRVGRLGRAFVEKYHSLSAMGKIYDGMIRKVYNGDPKILTDQSWFFNPCQP